MADVEVSEVIESGDIDIDDGDVAEMETIEETYTTTVRRKTVRKSLKIQEVSILWISRCQLLIWERQQSNACAILKRIRHADLAMEIFVFFSNSSSHAKYNWNAIQNRLNSKSIFSSVFFFSTHFQSGFFFASTKIWYCPSPFADVYIALKQYNRLYISNSTPPKFWFWKQTADSQT